MEGSFSWSQTEDAVEVLVNLRSALISDVDVFCSPLYVRVNYQPYLLHLDLFAAIVDTLSSAQVDYKTHCLRLWLRKEVSVRWPSLQFDPREACYHSSHVNCDAKELTKEARRNIVSQRRLDSMKRREAENELKRKKVEMNKAEMNRQLVREKMRIDQVENVLLDSRKAEAKRVAEKEVYETLSRLRHLEEVTSNPPVKPSTAPKQTLQEGCEMKTELKAKEQEEVAEEVIFVADGGCSSSSPNSSRASTAPGPRNMGPQKRDSEIRVAFTPRFFPAPSRASRKRSEEDFLLKNKIYLDQQYKVYRQFTEAAGSSGQASNDLAAEEPLGIEQRDPFWLKSIGDDLFQKGEYSGAINAYSTAVCNKASDEVGKASRSRNNPLLYCSCLSNRASCFLKMRRFSEAQMDCSMALKHLDAYEAQQRYLAEKTCSPVPEDFLEEAKKRCSLQSKLGAALFGMECFAEAKEHLTNALEQTQVLNTEPGSSKACQLREDVRRCQAFETISQRKLEADSMLSRLLLQNDKGQGLSIVELYDLCCDTCSPVFQSSVLRLRILCNKSACFYTMKDYVSCIEVCSLVLQQFKEKSDVTELLQEIRTRRAAAYQETQRYAEARVDLLEAFQEEPASEEIAKSLCLLDRLMSA